MSKYYLMAEKVSENGTIIRQKSHPFAQLKSGYFLEDFDDGPFECQLVDRFANGVLPTFYMSPAVIGTKQFYQDLQSCGVDNIEVKPVLIHDAVNNRTIDNYLLLNFIGRVSCADMDKSDYGEIDEDMYIMNKLVIDSKKVHDLNLFLVDEDTGSIVVSEQVYNYLTSKGYTDIYFEELEQI
jgi:hypothetical protein